MKKVYKIISSYIIVNTRISDRFLGPIVKRNLIMFVVLFGLINNSKLFALSGLSFTSGTSVNYTANTLFSVATISLTNGSTTINSTAAAFNGGLGLSAGDLVYAKIGTVWTKLGIWSTTSTTTRIRLTTAWTGSTAAGLAWCVISKTGANVTIKGNTTVTFDLDMGNGDSMLINTLTVGGSTPSPGTGTFIVNNANSIVNIRTSIVTGASPYTGTITLTNGKIRLWAKVVPNVALVTWNLSSTAGTFEYLSSSSAKNILGTTYFNLILNSNAITTYGTKTVLGSIVVKGTLTIALGSKLNLNGFSIPAVNAFSGTGQITGGATSRINITGPSAGTLYMDQTTSLTTNRLKYLGLAASATATLGNAIAIYGDSSYSGNVDLQIGSVLTSNIIGTNAALLQLKYNFTSDYHGVLGMNGGVLNGEALVENYFFNGSRTYRQVGHVSDSALSMNQITDDFDLFGSISVGNTGRGSAGNKDGLYAATTTAKNSVFTYKEDVVSGSKWIPFASGNSNSTIATGTGIMFVMRPTGSGESGSYDAQLMDYEGALNQRRRAVSVLKNSGTGTLGYNLLSNPYASYLNFDNFIDTNGAILADQGFYKYNKTTKNYSVHSKSGPQWYINSIAFGVNTANIDPGDAFWVRVNSVGAVYFHPDMTSCLKSLDVSRTNYLEVDTAYYSMLGIKMKSQSDTTIGDEVSILSASWGGDMSYKQNDMANMNGTCIDIAVVSSDQELLAFKTLDIKKSWLIPLNLQACAAGAYSFAFDVNANKPGYEAEYELLDKYLNKSIKIITGAQLSFEVNSDKGSMGRDRFYINAIPSKMLNNNDLKTEKITTIFPIPIAKTDVLKINLRGVGAVNIQIVNYLGQALYVADNVASGRIVEVDLMNLPLSTGIYYLKVSRDGESEIEKILIH